MKIQTNTAANSALGYMKVNAQNTERSIQRLSSGFRINRAADDAAGLAIANTLRADAKTLGQAQKNAAQASAMLQIADGATATIGNIFDRMRELASQGASANVGTQGQKLQDEWNLLYNEANRIIGGTKYQGTNVLTGLTAGASTAGTAGTFSGANITAAASIPSTLVDGTYTVKDGTAANAGKLQIFSGSTLVATSTATVSSGAGTVTFDNGMTLTKGSGFTAAVTGSAANNGSVAAGTATSANGFASATSSSTTTNGTYTFSSSANGDVTLTNGSATQTLSGVASGAGTMNFSSLGITVTKNSNFVTAAAGSTGTVTPGSGTGTLTYSAAANTTQNASANGTYTLHSDGTNLTLSFGGQTVGTIVQSTLTAGGQADFGNGISLTLGATYDNTGTALEGLTFGVANAAAATTMSLAGETITVSNAAPLVNAQASNADSSTFAISGQVTGAGAPSILVGTSASQTTGTLANRAAAYASQDSIALDLGTLDDMDIKNLSSSVNTGTGAAASGADLTTTGNAQDALARLDKAVAKLNTFVGKLGAAESRVDYASQNVESMLQNTQAAESSIRDADMAYEMTQFTKNNILQQAAQSMLSQANQGTQGILQLLRG